MTTITPTSKQSDAIKQIVDWYKNSRQKEFYLAGYAGVGKSTIANLAIEEIKSCCKISKIYTAAYTGKAASVLKRKGVSNAQTIHSLIYTPSVDKETNTVNFSIDRASLASDADLIVLDECSMVDDEMANDLRSFNKKILVMGDPGQLPPVKGAGAFTNRQPDVLLTEIHRQAAESPILELATMARQGQILPMGYSKENVQVLPLNQDTQRLIHNPNTQLLCGLNKVRWVVTQRIRRGLEYTGEFPEIGEKIICCKNNRKKGLFNGGLGTIASSRKSKNDWYVFDVIMEDNDKRLDSLQVDPFHFNNHFVEGAAQKMPYMPKRRLEEFDWGYVITCHKAQGSSWEHVTIIDDSGSFREHKNHWLYTAITRAEVGLTILRRER